MTNIQQLKEQVELLVQRLERLSADSVWAHRASGMRGSLLRLLEDLAETNRTLNAGTEDKLEELVRQGFTILTAAAREIPGPHEKSE